jgi:predicted benzoate:H+ symporter BenE
MVNGKELKKPKLFMKVESIEILLVTIIVTVQIWSSYKTYLKIKMFKYVIPTFDYLSIINIQIPKDVYENSSSSDVLSNIDI